MDIYNYRFKKGNKYDTRCNLTDYEIHNNTINFYDYIDSTDKIIAHKVDMRNLITDIYYMGDSVASAICSVLKMKKLMKKSLFSTTSYPTNPSRLYIYSLSKILERSKGPIFIETGLQIVKEYSCCDEALFPYLKHNINEYPPLRASVNASMYNLKFNYVKMSTGLYAYKLALSMGYPIIIGISIFDTFNSKKDGLITTPDLKFDNMIGAMAVVLVGYNEDKQNFIFLNNHGSDWGDKGFGYIMYSYIGNSDLCSDAFAIV